MLLWLVKPASRDGRRDAHPHFLTPAAYAEISDTRAANDGAPLECECGEWPSFLGNVIGFDKTPWPLLLTILNLPQLSIMISLQVSANRAQAASDRRAIADHETLIALHEMAKQQLDILHSQERVLSILDNFASRGMPGRQQAIQDTLNKILETVRPAER